ncbi:MAG: hypothetical protein WC782_00285 [Methylococcaceae bacterium]|jgi:hypothetical protein
MRIYALFISLALMSTKLALADSYFASLQQANWQYKQGNNYCQLQQAIPWYGLAKIIQRAGAALQFSVQEERPKPQVIKASLAAMPAPWIPGQGEPIAHQVYLDQADENPDFGQLSVYGATAEAMIDALLRGQYPTFTYIRASDNTMREETKVAVSSIYFSQQYPEFLACRNKLLSQANNAVEKVFSTRQKKPNKQTARHASQHLKQAQMTTEKKS